MNKVKYLKPSNIYSQKQVEEYLNIENNVKWVAAKDLLGELNDSCVDGREVGHIIASPGGDTALLAEAIISVGKMAQRHLDPFEIRKVFRWRVKRLGSFYHHTDEHALENLRKSLNDDPVIKRKFKNIQAVLKFVKNPPASLQTSLMSHLFKTDNIGCGHLKLVLLNAPAYGMSVKVIQGILRAYFNMMWNGTREEKKLIDFRVLMGEHKEGAVISVLVPGKVSDKTMVPMVRPTDGKTSVFVYHPQVVEFMHNKQAVELLKSGLFPEIKKSQVGEYQKMMMRVLGEGLRETVSRLAFGLPMYSFEFKINK